MRSRTEQTTLTIRVPANLRNQVAKSAKARHLSQRAFVRNAICDKLWEEALDASRTRLVRAARAIGIYTDEDVFKIVS